MHMCGMYDDILLYLPMENKEQEGMHTPNMTHEAYEAMSLELRRNKEQMFHILQHNPKVGVYLN